MVFHLLKPLTLVTPQKQNVCTVEPEASWPFKGHVHPQI